MKNLSEHVKTLLLNLHDGNVQNSTSQKNVCVDLTNKKHNLLKSVSNLVKNINGALMALSSLSIFFQFLKILHVSR